MGFPTDMCMFSNAMQTTGLPLMTPFKTSFVFPFFATFSSLSSSSIISIGLDTRTFAFISKEYFINSGHVFVRPLNEGKNILIRGETIFFGSIGKRIVQHFEFLLSETSTT